MIIIYGTLNSGKTSKALNLIKGKENLLYISLDNDFSVRKSSDITDRTYRKIKNCFMIDIEMEVVNNKIKTLVIDSINFIKLTKSLNNDFNFKTIISDIEYLESAYGLEVIATYNILETVSRMEKDMISFLEKRECNLIKVENRKRKITSKTQVELSQFP